MRTLPPVSVPSPISASPAATAAAEPPEEPPTTWPGNTGFFTSGVVTPSPPASVRGRPTTRTPACFRRRTAAASVSARREANSGSPAVNGWPSTAMLSFTATVRPDSGPATELSSSQKERKALQRSAPAGDIVTSRLPSITSPLVARAVHQRFFLAAVDLDHGAVDHVHQRRRQHDDQVGNLVDLGDAPHRDRRRRELVGFLVGQLHVARHRLDQAGPALGAHRARIDRAEADIVLAVLDSER